MANRVAYHFVSIAGVNRDEYCSRCSCCCGGIAGRFIRNRCRIRRLAKGRECEHRELGRRKDICGNTETTAMVSTVDPQFGQRGR